METLKHFTTGEIAKICGTSRVVVNQWCNCGILKYYLLPFQKQRRILFDTLVEFVKEYNLPVTKLTIQKAWEDKIWQPEQNAGTPAKGHLQD